MDDDAHHDEDGAVNVQLDVYLDRQPVTGRLRTRHGADERFVGWLGFVDALKRAGGHPQNIDRYRPKEQQ
jgi:hypothetical protein